ncbi:hypothetical protein J1605_006370 [Eschrichtius robustus]|uniref:Uncharacterized protein n=1 Tax=Eschrichtius robustus TaxID=9764 RepID=A0AB34H655_ESCRO|nr:hypothetical protein J1605_006370 [Eschrichtius robustus]
MQTGFLGLADSICRKFVFYGEDIFHARISSPASKKKKDDGEHGILQHLKGQQSGHEHQLHAGESVEGGVPAWKHLMDRNMTLWTYQEYDRASALGNLTF